MAAHLCRLRRISHIKNKTKAKTKKIPAEDYRESKKRQGWEWAHFTEKATFAWTPVLWVDFAPEEVAKRTDMPGKDATWT